MNARLQKAREFMMRHKEATLFGIKILSDPELIEQICESLIKTGVEIAKEKEALYEKALDYVSK